MLFSWRELAEQPQLSKPMIMRELFHPSDTSVTLLCTWSNRSMAVLHWRPQRSQDKKIKTWTISQNQSLVLLEKYTEMLWRTPLFMSYVRYLWSFRALEGTTDDGGQSLGFWQLMWSQQEIITSLSRELFTNPRGLKDKLSLLTSWIKLFFCDQIVNIKPFFFSEICNISEQGVNLSKLLRHLYGIFWVQVWNNNDTSRVVSIVG